LNFACFYGRVRVLDCYSDPLGWKDRILKSAGDGKDSLMEHVTVFKDVRDTSKLFTSILDLGRGHLVHCAYVLFLES